MTRHGGPWIVEKILGFLFYTVGFPIVIANEGYEKGFIILLGYQLFAFPIILILHDWSGEDWFNIKMIRRYLLLNWGRILCTITFIALYFLHALSITNSHLLVVFVPVFGRRLKIWIYSQVPEEKRWMVKKMRRFLFFILFLWQLAPFLLALMLRFGHRRNLARDIGIMSFSSVAATLYWSAIASGILALPKLWR